MNSFAIATIDRIARRCGTAIAVSDQRAPGLGSALRTTPAWLWTGGILGAVYIFAAVYCIKSLGAVGLVATVVLGQMIGAVLLDSFGVLHPAVPLTAQRLVGCLLTVAGLGKSDREAGYLA